MAAFLTANSVFGICPEVTRGTVNGAGTAVWIPVATPQVTPTQMFLRDEALRGSPVVLYDQVQGVRHDEMDFKSYLYADSFPNIIKALLGGTDTVSGATSITHTMKLLYAAATGSQPASYSLQDFDGANYFLMLGAQASDATITFGAEVAADATTKWIANPYTSATSASAPFTAPGYSTESLIPSWDATMSVGGSSLTYISSGEIKIDRKTAPIFTMGTQAPYQNFAGPIDVTGKFTCVVASNADPFSTGVTGYALTRSPQAIAITLTNPNNAHLAVQDSLAFTMTSSQFQVSKRTRGKDFTELEVEWMSNADATDATTGYSPLSFVAVNGQVAAY